MSGMGRGSPNLLSPSFHDCWRTTAARNCNGYPVFFLIVLVAIIGSRSESPQIRRLDMGGSSHACVGDRDLGLTWKSSTPFSRSMYIVCSRQENLTLHSMRTRLCQSEQTTCIYDIVEHNRMRTFWLVIQDRFIIPEMFGMHECSVFTTRLYGLWKISSRSPHFSLKIALTNLFSIESFLCDHVLPASFLSQ